MFAFDKAIQLVPGEAGFFDGELLSEWCIGAVPHGGYLLSVLLNAAKMHSQTKHGDLAQLDPIQLSVSFIVKAQVGKTRISVQDVKVGRSYSNYKLMLQQQEDEGHWITCLHAFVIMGTFTKEDGPAITTTTHYVPPLHDCPEMLPHHSEFRHVAKNFRYWESTTPKSPATERHWLRFQDERPMDVLAMALISDLMTPLPLRVFDVPRGWYPTLSLDLQFKKAPKADGLYTYLTTETDSVVGGRFDITTRCFDDNHDLIAISRHAALMVSAARNLSKRSSRSKI